MADAATHTNGSEPNLSPVAEAAIGAVRAGLSVVPPRQDGSKRPLTEWAEYQTRRPRSSELERWYAGTERTGVGAVLGAVSKNTECLEFDDTETYAAFVGMAELSGLGDVVKRIEDGYLEETPSGGRHWLYRCDEIAGNTKLARRPKTPDEMRDENDKVKVLIETRGEGGYVVLAPSNGTVHPSGRCYRLVSGSFATIAELTPEERDDLFALARTFDAMPRAREETTAKAKPGGPRPGDNFNARASWSDVLDGHGWKLVTTRGKEGYWRRPGKDEGVSATTNYEGSDLLYVFTTSTVFEAERGYSKFSAFGILNYEGDWSVATKELVRRGYGQTASAAPSMSPPPLAEDVKDEAITASLPPIPDAAFFGSFARYRDVMAPTSEAPDVFHLGSALTLVGAMTGRRVYAEYASEQLFANLYTVLIGASGSSRKDTAIKRSTNLAYWSVGRVVTPAFYISRDVSSSEGIVQTLKNYPNTWLYLTELSAMLSNAKRKSTSSIVDRLIEAWDTPEVLQNLNKQSPAEARKPYLSIIAATQPGRLAAELRAEDIHSGFANRWLYFAGAGKPPMARPASIDRKAAWLVYLEWFDAIHSYTEDQVIGWDGSANERWDKWYIADAGGRGIDEDEDAMRVRHATLIRKLALVYAVSEGAKKIGDRHLAPAITLIDWMWTCVKVLMREWGIGIGNQIEARIEDVLRKRGPMARRDLSKLLKNRKWTNHEQVQKLRSLIEGESVAILEDGRLAWNG